MVHYSTSCELENIPDVAENKHGESLIVKFVVQLCKGYFNIYCNDLDFSYYFRTGTIDIVQE